MCALLRALPAELPVPTPRSGQKIKIVRHNAPALANLHGQLLTLSGGCDATLLPGISPFQLDETDRRSGDRSERLGG